MTSPLFLAQTDTTVGFLSSSIDVISSAKKRESSKPVLLTTSSFKKLQNLTRVPRKFKKLVRNSKKTTFIYPSTKAIRVIKDGNHSEFLEKFDFLYSSSANLSGESFDYSLAKSVVDVEVLDSRGFHESRPSKLIKLNNKKTRRLR